MTDNKKLVVRSEQHLTKQLEIANIQLSIGSELAQDMERRKFVEILKSVDKEEAVAFLSENAYLNEALIEKFKDKWNWGYLADNRSVTWSLELIKNYEDKWWDLDGDVGFSYNDSILPFIMKLIDEFKDKDWALYFLAKHRDLPWSIELIEKIDLIAKYQSKLFNNEYIEKIVWESLSENNILSWSLELIEKFEDRWDWEALSSNNSLPWSEVFIEKYGNKLNWNNLSRNTALPWSEEFIGKYENIWNWGVLSINESLLWSIELIEKYKGYWEWYNLSGNETLPWTLDFFEKYKDRWHWQALSSNEAIPWSIELIKKYQNRWNWEKLSENAVLPLSLELIGKYKDQWNGRESSYDENGYREGRSKGKFISYDFGWNGYYNLSRNEALLWPLELIEKYADKWCWSSLSANEALPWSLELIEKYQDKWNWSSLSANEALPWSLELIEKYADKWNWSSLSANEALPWTLELIEKFKESWTFERLFNNSGINLSGDRNMNYTALACLPKLSMQDIDEVMSYHFPLTQISKQSNDFDDDLPF